MAYLQFTPFYINKTDSVVQFNPDFTLNKYFKLERDYTVLFPEGTIDSNRTSFKIRQTQDAYQIATVVPRSLVQGLAVIGGFLSLFGLVFTIMRIVHQECLTRSLIKFLKRQNHKPTSSEAESDLNEGEASEEAQLVQAFEKEKVNYRSEVKRVFSFESFYRTRVKLINMQNDSLLLEQELAEITHEF